MNGKHETQGFDLKITGCWLANHGRRNSLYCTHPNSPGVKTSIPCHNEINQYTAKGIFKDAGLKEA